jgi:hypothetical protein
MTSYNLKHILTTLLAMVKQVLSQFTNPQKMMKLAKKAFPNHGLVRLMRNKLYMKTAQS